LVSFKIVSESLNITVAEYWQFLSVSDNREMKAVVNPCLQLCVKQALIFMSVLYERYT